MIIYSCIFYLAIIVFIVLCGYIFTIRLDSLKNIKEMEPFDVENRIPLVLNEPQNLMDSKGQIACQNLHNVKTYYQGFPNNSLYDRDIITILAFHHPLIHNKISDGKMNRQKMAIIVDIDDTVICTFPYSVKSTGCTDKDLDNIKSHLPINPVLNFLKNYEKQTDIVFITARPNSVNNREFTHNQLQKLGIKYKELHMKDSSFSSSSEFKRWKREKIKNKGYRLIASIGDQFGDLGDDVEISIKLPNPMYLVQ